LNDIKSGNDFADAELTMFEEIVLFSWSHCYPWRMGKFLATTQSWGGKRRACQN